MDIRDIPLDQILEPEVPIRTIADEEKIAELRQSMKETGLLQPLVVRPEGDKFRLIAGYCRRLAAISLDWETVPCNVVEVGPAEAAMMLLAENLNRQDVDPIDEAKYYQYLIGSLGLTPQQIAEKIGKTDGYVYNHLRLLKLDEDTKHDVQYRGLAYSTALQLGRVPDKATRDYLRTTAVKSGASTRVVHDWVEDALRQPQNFDAGDVTVPAVGEIPKSTYTPPECILCGRTIDMGGLQNIWICSWDLEAIKRGMEDPDLP